MAGIIDFYREHKDTQPTQGSTHPITSGAVYDALSQIKQFTYTVVDQLPEASESTMYCLYFVPSDDPKVDDADNEYITVRSGTEGNYIYTWELVGNTSVDISDKCDSSCLGYPTFNENTAYAANDIVFHEGKLYYFNQAHAAGAWDSSEVSLMSIRASLQALTTGKADRVQNATDGNLASLNASGNLVDSGIRIIKMSQAEYDALQNKDALTVYITQYSSVGNGVYIYYTDGSISSYDTLSAGKTPVGVVLKNQYVSLLLHPTEGVGVNWSGDDSTEIVGVITTTEEAIAKEDYAGAANTAAVVAARKNGTAFDFTTSIGTSWYLPACGELEQIRLNATNINTALSLISGTVIDFTNNLYWSSTQNSSSAAWRWQSGVWFGGYKLQNSNDKRCRAVSPFAASLDSSRIYLGSILIADSNTINDIASILATI